MRLYWERKTSAQRCIHIYVRLSASIYIERYIRTADRQFCHSQSRYTIHPALSLAPHSFMVHACMCWCCVHIGLNVYEHIFVLWRILRFRSSYTGNVSSSPLFTSYGSLFLSWFNVHCTLHYYCYVQFTVRKCKKKFRINVIEEKESTKKTTTTIAFHKRKI